MANANGSKVGNAVRAALAFMFGGKRGNGFVATAGATRPGEIGTPPSAESVKRLLEKYHGGKQERPTDGPKLVTQKDGRQFAVEVLERLDNVDGDESTACPFNPDAEEDDSMNLPQYYRTGPQWDGFYKDLSRLVNDATEDARKGFASIVTDALAGSISMSLESYREWESAGYLQDMGRYGSEMALPQPAKVKRRKQTKAEKKAAKLLSESFYHMYALDDIAKRLGQSALEYHTIRSSVVAIIDVLQSVLRKAIAALPTIHPGYKFAGEMNRNLAAMQVLIDKSDDGSGRFKQSRCDVGAEMLVLVRSLGRAIEKTELACGEPIGTAGYLSGDLGGDQAKVEK